jgi:protease-4
MLRKSIALALLLLPLALGGCLQVNLGPAPLRTVQVEPSGRWFESNRIAVIDIDGFIGAGHLPLGIEAGANVADVKERLDRAAADPAVRAVVLRINSPGGEVSASDAIYDEVARFRRDSGKPVVAACIDLATSGGYYVALAADRIVGAPTAITGSIGVVMNLVNVEGLFGKIGLRAESIKSGGMKDIGSPVRAMSDEERKVLQGINETLFNRFLALVRERRPAMTQADLALVADGRVIPAPRALELHLFDRIGYLRDAIAEARDLAGIRSADVVLYQRLPAYNSNIYAQWQRPAGLLEEGLEVLLRRQHPGFLYLWSPTP